MPSHGAVANIRTTTTSLGSKTRRELYLACSYDIQCCRDGPWIEEPVMAGTEPLELGTRMLWCDTRHIAQTSYLPLPLTVLEHGMRCISHVLARDKGI